ncbi:MAG: LemA family protein [Betaproteobacteria bacterium]|nr:LemA family protein [Betaproteobacteria bacterium]
MSVLMLVLIAAAVIVFVYGVLLYNGLVQLKHNVAKAWSNIDVLLKQRHDELPKLVETCRQYKEFEQATLEKVIAARARVHEARERQDLPALGQAESMLRAGLGTIFAVAEAYPELKANEQFQHLLTRITGLENAIADRREFYNESTNLYNVRREQVPDNILVGMFDFPPRQLLKFSSEEKADVNLKHLFA